MDLYIILKWLSISFFVWSTPMIINKIVIANHKRKQESFKVGILYLLEEILSCFKCTSFWFTLIVTQDFVISSIVALFAFIIMSQARNL
jgi:hypothetical protein